MDDQGSSSIPKVTNGDNQRLVAEILKTNGKREIADLSHLEPRNSKMRRRSLASERPSRDPRDEAPMESPIVQGPIVEYDGLSWPSMFTCKIT